MARWLDPTRLREVLAQTGLRAPLGIAWRILRHPSRIRYELALLADYRRFKRRYGFLAERGPRAHPGKTVLVVSLTDLPYKVKEEAMLAKALQLRGYTPVILTFSWCRRGMQYHRVFGFDQFVFLDRLLAQVPTAVREALQRDAAEFLSRPLSVQMIKRFEYRGVHVGRQVLSTITRSRFAGRIVLDNPAIREQFARLLPKAMQAVHAAELLFDRLSPTVALYHEKGYIDQGPIFETALNRGIPGIHWCSPYREDCLVFKRYTRQSKHLQAFSLSRQSWEAVREMPWTDRYEQELAQEFKDRYEDGKWFLAKRLQDGKILKNKEAVQRQLDLDPQKKTAVIFSHITWDASFFHGEDLFEDYEDWLIETVRAACANPAVNWIVKLHPANVFKLRADDVHREYSERLALRKAIGTLPPHVKLLDPETDINTFSLFTLTDYCLTVRGTIGIEMACFGIPVFTAGTGRYAGLGFTIDSAHRQEYLEKLRGIQEVLPLSSQQTELAKKHAYALFKLRPAQFHAFKIVFLRPQHLTHPLYWNLAIAARSPQDLLKASDLEAFAKWTADSKTEDFLLEAPAS